MMIDVRFWLVHFKIHWKASKINLTVHGKIIWSFGFIYLVDILVLVIEVVRVHVNHLGRNIVIVVVVPVIEMNIVVVKIMMANIIVNIDVGKKSWRVFSMPSIEKKTKYSGKRYLRLIECFLFLSKWFALFCHFFSLSLYIEFVHHLFCSVISSRSDFLLSLYLVLNCSMNVLLKWIYFCFSVIFFSFYNEYLSTLKPCAICLHFSVCSMESKRTLID